jgi:hypothetical protein
LFTALPAICFTCSMSCFACMPSKEATASGMSGQQRCHAAQININTSPPTSREQALDWDKTADPEHNPVT